MQLKQVQLIARCYLAAYLPPVLLTNASSVGLVNCWNQSETSWAANVQSLMIPSAVFWKKLQKLRGHNHRTPSHQMKYSVITSYNLMSTDDDPYDWRYKHRELFPNLAVIARYCLAASASNVANERIFSEIGELLESKRKRLGGKNFSMLLAFPFLNLNLSCLNYYYNRPKYSTKSSDQCEL